MDQADDSSRETSEYEQIKVMTLDPERVDLEHINNLVELKYPRQIYVTMEVEGREVRFQVDSSTTCNIIPRKYARKLWNTNQVLSMCNGTTVVSQQETTAGGICRCVRGDLKAGRQMPSYAG